MATHPEQTTRPYAPEESALFRAHTAVGLVINGEVKMSAGRAYIDKCDWNHHQTSKEDVYPIVHGRKHLWGEASDDKAETGQFLSRK